VIYDIWGNVTMYVYTIINNITSHSRKVIVKHMCSFKLSYEVIFYLILSQTL